MLCCTQCPGPAAGRRRPTPAPDSWTLTGKSGSVSCGVTAPFSWVLVHKALLCPPRVYFPVCVSSGGSMVGLMGVPTAWQDEVLARDGVSREVPRSALKGETVPDSLPATPQKAPDTPGSPEGNTEGPGTASSEPLLFS